MRKIAYATDQRLLDLNNLTEVYDMDEEQRWTLGQHESYMNK